MNDEDIEKLLKPFVPIAFAGLLISFVLFGYMFFRDRALGVEVSLVQFVLTELFILSWIIFFWYVMKYRWNWFE